MSGDKRERIKNLIRDLYAMLYRLWICEPFAENERDTFILTSCIDDKLQELQAVMEEE